MPMPSKYKPEYCEKLVAHCSEGNPYETFGCELGVSRATLYNWEREFPEWAEAKLRAKDGQLKWWTNLGKALIAGKIKGSAAVYIFTMKNICDWKDVQRNEVTGADGQSFKIIVEDYTTPTKT